MVKFLLECWKELKNIKFRKEKLQLKHSIVHDIVYEISHEGVRPDRKCIEAITKLMYPENKNKL